MPKLRHNGDRPKPTLLEHVSQVLSRTAGASSTACVLAELVWSPCELELAAEFGAPHALLFTQAVGVLAAVLQVLLLLAVDSMEFGFD